jgi:hypothetical protein
VKRLVRFTMSGINSIITDHFKMFFRDVLSKPWHEIKNRDGFFPVEEGRYDKVLVIGENAVKQLTLGGGSPS